MHSSIIITSLCAALAVAKPMQHLRKHVKKDYVTDLEVVVETVFVTVTPGAASPPVETPPPVEATTVVVMNTVYVKPEAPSSPPKAAVFIAKSRSKVPVVVAPTPIVVAAPPATTAAPVVANTPEAVAEQVKAPVTVAAPAVVAAPASSGYEGTILDRHNAHRANHSANALTYNTTLAGYAKNTALTCRFAHDMTQGGGGYGQNIVQNGRAPWTGVDIASAAAFGITEEWYNGEEPLYASSYKKDNPVTSADVQHFTQVVWKATTDVGCYTAQCAQGTISGKAPTAYTVCNYWPRGNFGGQYAKNVSPPQGSGTQHATIKWSS